MDEAAAQVALSRGSLVAIITIPQNFSYALAHGQAVTLRVAVDNVNTDMTDDIQRALPSAVVAFGKHYHFPGIRVQATEVDLVDHDTGFIPYLVVSGLALDAFIIASILSAMTVAREFETKTIRILSVAPVHPLFSLLGRMLATDTMASIALIFPVALAVFGYHIVPLHQLEVIGALLLCVAIFGCVGVALGTILKRTLPVVTLIFGLGFPLYLGSGSLEPQRFDGEVIWMIAHLSPVYYAVGILEYAFHGLRVTPESLAGNFLGLLGWAVCVLLLAGLLLRTARIEQSARPREQRVLIERRSPWPHRVLFGSCWLLVGLLLLTLGGEARFGEQPQQANALQLQKQQQARLAASAEEQREALLSKNYVQQMSSLIVQDPPAGKITDSTRASASTLTQSTLPQLNCEHKVALLRYLYKRKLIDDDFHVVNLQGADFQACNLSGLDLSDTDLTGANFSAADMQNVKLHSSTLIAVDFSDADLSGADLKSADMHNAALNNTNLARADMLGIIGKSVEQLLPARSLAGTRLPDGSVQPGEVQDTD